MIDTENIVLKNIREIIQTISFKLSYQITQTRETILFRILLIIRNYHVPSSRKINHR